MAITLRNAKGSELTFTEMDGNFSDLDTRVRNLENSNETPDYLSLTNKPFIPGDISDLTDSNNLLSASDYDNASVDAHINTSSAVSGYVLSWNGVDYEWVQQTQQQQTGIQFDDLSITQNSAAGGGTLSYDNVGGFTYTPPDLSNYVTSNVLTAYATLNYINNQNFATQSFVISQNYLTGADLGAYATTAYVNGQGFLTSENDTLATVTARGSTTSTAVTFNGGITASNIAATGVGTPGITSSSSIELSSADGVRVTGGGPFRLPNFTNAQRDALGASNGDMIYNTDNNRPEMYVNGAWKIVDTSPIV